MSKVAHRARPPAVARGRGRVDASLHAQVVADDYAWEDDQPLHVPLHDAVVYEVHVGGFTRGSGSPVPPGRQGTLLGLIDTIPYLKDLGIKAERESPLETFFRRRDEARRRQLPE